MSNLKYWASCKSVLDKTLHLFNDLSIGISSVRKLATLEVAQFMLENHTVSGSSQCAAQLPILTHHL